MLAMQVMDNIRYVPLTSAILSIQWHDRATTDMCQLAGIFSLLSQKCLGWLSNARRATSWSAKGSFENYLQTTHETGGHQPQHVRSLV